MNLFSPVCVYVCFSALPRLANFLSHCVQETSRDGSVDRCLTLLWIFRPCEVRKWRWQVAHVNWNMRSEREIEPWWLGPTTCDFFDCEIDCVFLYTRSWLFVKRDLLWSPAEAFLQVCVNTRVPRDYKRKNALPTCEIGRLYPKFKSRWATMLKLPSTTSKHLPIGVFPHSIQNFSVHEKRHHNAILLGQAVEGIEHITKILTVMKVANMHLKTVDGTMRQIVVEYLSSKISDAQLEAACVDCPTHRRERQQSMLTAKIAGIFFWHTPNVRINLAFSLDVWDQKIASKKCTSDHF